MSCVSSGQPRPSGTTSRRSWRTCWVTHVARWRRRASLCVTCTSRLSPHGAAAAVASVAVALVVKGVVGTRSSTTCRVCRNAEQHVAPKHRSWTCGHAPMGHGDTRSYARRCLTTYQGKPLMHTRRILQRKASAPLAASPPLCGTRCPHMPWRASCRRCTPPRQPQMRPLPRLGGPQWQCADSCAPLWSAVTEPAQKLPLP
mmetsp:Transcript_16216/g.48585  ORF Transcript_16216/g.48585 Transcript_16216/m.48585 type:complete len:201 (+) Transcript_16216:746-1348(+)